LAAENQAEPSAPGAGTGRSDVIIERERGAALRLGTVLKGKWTIQALLGSGGMASVYGATHRNGKRVAIKLLHPELSMNLAIRQRFLREGYVANSVQHAGAVSVDDEDVTDDGCAFLVMELLEGETLDARWERKGRRLEAPEVLALMDQVLDTLSAAHEKGIVHRDLKPENLFLTHGGQVKVLDFGIARVRELSLGASHTQTGSLMGTPTFMPPEQARGRWSEVDGASDIWAVGATMFALLTGRFVHLSTTVNEALVLAVTQPAPSVGAVGVALPVEVVALVDRALAYEKDARWPDARAMQDALRHAYASLTNKPITLLDAIDDDEPSAAAWPGTVIAHETVITRDGVMATPANSGIGVNGLSRVRLRVAAAVGMTTLIGVFALVGNSRRSDPRPPDEKHVAASPAADSMAASPLPEADAKRDSTAVVPIERLPAAPADASIAPRNDSPRRNPELSRFPSAAIPLASASSGLPTAARSNTRASDPFAARR